MAASSPMVNRGDTTPTERHAAPSHGPPPRHALFRPEHIKVPICHLALSQHASTMRAPPPQQQQTARPIEWSAVKLKGGVLGGGQSDWFNMKLLTSWNTGWPLKLRPESTRLLLLRSCRPCFRWMCVGAPATTIHLCDVLNNVHIITLSMGEFWIKANRTSLLSTNVDCPAIRSKTNDHIKKINSGNIHWTPDNNKTI